MHSNVSLSGQKETPEYKEKRPITSTLGQTVHFYRKCAKNLGNRDVVFGKLTHVISGSSGSTCDPYKRLATSQRLFSYQFTVMHERQYGASWSTCFYRCGPVLVCRFLLVKYPKNFEEVVRRGNISGLVGIEMFKGDLESL